MRQECDCCVSVEQATRIWKIVGPTAYVPGLNDKINKIYISIVPVSVDSSSISAVVALISAIKTRKSFDRKRPSESC